MGKRQRNGGRHKPPSQSRPSPEQQPDPTPTPSPDTPQRHNIVTFVVAGLDTTDLRRLQQLLRNSGVRFAHRHTIVPRATLDLIDDSRLEPIRRQLEKFGQFR